MGSYWEDIEEYNQKEHDRTMDYIKKKHEYKMDELKKEVELHKLKERVKK